MADEQDDALVANAADASQVKRARRKEKDRRNRELADLRAVLALPAGRRMLWRLLEQCRVFASIYDEGPRIHYRAGQQDVGHYVLAEINAAEPEALFTMMRENQEKPNG